MVSFLAIKVLEGSVMRMGVVRVHVLIQIRLREERIFRKNPVVGDKILHTDTLV